MQEKKRKEESMVHPVEPARQTETTGQEDGATGHIYIHTLCDTQEESTESAGPCKRPALKARGLLQRLFPSQEANITRNMSLR